MKNYHSELFERIKEEVEMERALEHYGFEVKKHQCLCPFHNDTKPSMRVYKNSFYCFSCGTGGDVVKFVALYLDVGNFEAAKIIAKDFGIRAEVGSLVEYAAIRRRELEREKKQRFLTWIKKATDTLCDYHLQLLKDADTYRPRNTKADIDDRFIFAVLELEKTSEMLESLNTDDTQELIRFYHTNCKEVNIIEQRLGNTGREGRRAGVG